MPPSARRSNGIATWCAPKSTVTAKLGAPRPCANFPRGCARANAYKHPGPRRLGGRCSRALALWSLIALLRSSRAPRLTTPPRSSSSCQTALGNLRAVRCELCSAPDRRHPRRLKGSSPGNRSDAPRSCAPGGTTRYLCVREPAGCTDLSASAVV